MEIKANEVVFGYDRIKINCCTPFLSLRHRGFIKQIRPLCHSLHVLAASDKASKSRFKSSINLVAPSKKALVILQENETSLERYTISYLEIARDEMFDTIEEAKLRHIESMMHLYRKYTSYRFEFHGIDSVTFYLSPKTNTKFKFKSYTTISKVTNRPCLHEEFTVIGAYSIRTKTTIRDIDDLITIGAETCYISLAERYLVYSDIDRIKIGKRLSGLTRRRKLTEQEKMKCQLAASFFLSHLTCEFDCPPCIRSPSELKQALSEFKKQIKMKVGRKTLFEKRALQLRMADITKETEKIR